MKQKIDYFNIPEIVVTFRDNFVTAERDCINKPEDAVKIFQKIFKDFVEHHEEFWAMYLNGGGRVIGVQQIAKGGADKVQVDTRMVLQAAVKCNATAIILCHNHTNNVCFPSESDINSFMSDKQGLANAGFVLWDNLIITKDKWYSFKKSNIFELCNQ